MVKITLKDGNTVEYPLGYKATMVADQLLVEERLEDDGMRILAELLMTEVESFEEIA